MCKLKDFKELIALSVTVDEPQVVSCDMELDINGQTWAVYEASVANRDIFLFSDKGTATFLVDSYGSRHVAELVDWDVE